jgi:hypothetical protein
MKSFLLFDSFLADAALAAETQSATVVAALLAMKAIFARMLLKDSHLRFRDIKFPF